MGQAIVRQGTAEFHPFYFTSDRSWGSLTRGNGLRPNAGFPPTPWAPAGRRDDKQGINKRAIEWPAKGHGTQPESSNIPEPPRSCVSPALP